MKFSHIRLLVCTLAACMACTSLCHRAAAQPYSVSLADARRMALDSARSMKSARLLVEKARLEKNAVRAKFLPRISGYGYYLYTNGRMTTETGPLRFPIYKMVNGELQPDIMLGPDYKPIYVDGNPLFNQYAVVPPLTFNIDLNGSYTAGVMLEQPIFVGGKIATGYGMARLAREMARINTEKSRVDLLVKVDEAYWLYVQTQQMQEAALSFGRTVDSLYAKVSHAVANGMALRSDLLKVEVQVNKARLLEAKTRNGRKLSGMNLCHYMGLPLDTPIEASETDFDTLEDPDVVSGSLSMRPDYQLLEKKTEMARRQIAMTRADFLPQIGVAATYGYTHALKLNDKILWNKDAFSVIASVKIPLFAWGEGYYKTKSAKLDYKRAQLEQEDLEEMMILEQTKLEQELAEARLQVTLARSVETTATAHVKQAQDRYETGMDTLTSVLEAQTQWHQAKSEYIEAVTAYRLTYVKYLKSIGAL